MHKVLFASALALITVGCSDGSNNTIKLNSNSTAQNQNSIDMRGHPEASLQVLKDYVKPGVMVLDIGSGSGIGPRQLVANGFKDIVVLEANDQMIKDAKAANITGQANVEYIKGDLDKGLPYPAGKFDVATAFSAFHCNASPQAVKEVYRLLKPEGYFFIIRGLEKSSDPVRTKTTQIIEQAIGQKIPSVNIDSVNMLKDQGFKIILNTTIPVVEYFTKNEYLNYMKSYCSWEYAQKSPKLAEIEQKISQYLDTLKDKDGVIKIEMNAPVILAQKTRS